MSCGLTSESLPPRRSAAPAGSDTLARDSVFLAVNGSDAVVVVQIEAMLPHDVVVDLGPEQTQRFQRWPSLAWNAQSQNRSAPTWLLRFVRTGSYVGLGLVRVITSPLGMRTTMEA